MRFKLLIYVVLLWPFMLYPQSHKPVSHRAKSVKRTNKKPTHKNTTKGRNISKSTLSYKPVFRRDGKKYEDTVARNPNRCVIVIDPGHGGRDPGREGTKARGFQHEKELALEIAILVGLYLEEDLPAAKLYFTREDDITVSLEERVNLANRLSADYFVSIHLNSNPNRNVQGTRTHIHDHSFKVSRMLALAIEEEYSKAGLISRGIQSSKDRGENLYVLQYSEMPGVLTEAGFLTNPDEEAFLNSKEGQEKIAAAIANAIVRVVNSKHNLEVHKSYYCVQIEASDTPQDLTAKRFKDLGMQVREILAPENQVYRYKYVVGREYEENLARELAAKVRAAGFKGAFVIKIDPEN